MKTLQTILRQYYANIQSDGSYRNTMLRKYINLLDEVINCKYPNEEISENVVKLQIKKINKMGLNELASYKTKISLSSLNTIQKKIIYSAINERENKLQMSNIMVVNDDSVCFDDND